MVKKILKISGIVLLVLLVAAFAIPYFFKDQIKAKILESIGINHNRLHTIEPLGYLEFNYLVENAKAVITDSGGITEETTVMGIPCMTLRNNTERPETVRIGTNELIGTDPKAIKPAMDKLFAGNWKKGAIPEMWDGKTAERIVSILTKIETIA